MVTRVDKKPVIYNTAFIRSLKPSVIASNKATLSLLVSKACGHRIPSVTPREVLDDYEDIEYAFKLFGIDDPTYNMFTSEDDDIDDDTIRIARLCLDKLKSPRQLMRSEMLMEGIANAQGRILKQCDRVYFGTEAVYQVFSRCLSEIVFERKETCDYQKWCLETAKKVLLIQAPYLMIHPAGMNTMTEGLAKDVTPDVWKAWCMYKQIETMSIRLGSRKNTLAHAYYAGIARRGFTPAKNVEEDFLLPTTGFCATQEGVSVHYLLGLRYVRIGEVLCILSHDDSINLSSMAQCYYRTAMYFSGSNGYPPGHIKRALALIRDIAIHACQLIDVKKNFSHIIRSMHILAQGEFNDCFELDVGTDLGWKERSANYRKEARDLDPLGERFFNRAVELATTRIDRLNTCFIYHVFVGDEMQIEDLDMKVKNITAKVLPADKKEWSDFLKFVKTYTLCRFMHVFKKRPKVGGNIELMNEQWASRCINGTFTMPPHSQWGDVWIEGEFRYGEYADTWHLDAQDVAYVMKDSKGIVNSKYLGSKVNHSELLMAMTHGNILDTITGSTAFKARERIVSSRPVTEVVLTTAPKAENAKPSWKKRVTFAADCEFRKMQAEYDKNCRRVMSFIRGPSLGVDQCILEKQFADISDATATGMSGAICSHDISAWSESMDRDRKFEFEQILINMFDRPGMINIKNDWAQIKGLVTKQGKKNIYKIENSSFQGFDGSSSTILHSMILIYCLDTARRREIIPPDVRTNMATLIDDCIALMLNLHKTSDAQKFWAHLKDTYLKLGFEIDDLKSIFSTIKAIYLSRRFLMGGEVPSDFKVFIKAHSSYEDPLRCTLDVPSDIFGALRGACDANGEPWFIYFSAVLSSLADIAHNNSIVLKIPPAAASVFALAPAVENGWGFPSIISWSTNDVTDKRNHFNAMLELAAHHESQPDDFKHNVHIYTSNTAKAVTALKSQAWRLVSYANIFTNPFEAIREGPLKPDMLKRNAVQELLREVATAEPWVSLLKWNISETTQRVRELLIQSGYLHAPTLSALVNCMPDNYRLSVLGKATGSDSLMSLLSPGMKILLKRRVQRCSSAYFKYSYSVYLSADQFYTSENFAAMSFTERTMTEREEFYSVNGVKMTDHTFPDPVATFTTSSKPTASVISPNASSLRVWDKTDPRAQRTSHFVSDKGMYVPRKSGRVWEVTCEYAKGWDSVSQRIAMGLAVLARAEADGHKVGGLLVYFIKAWNEVSTITPADTHLIAIHGNIKRLDANPGSATHPIIVNRNLLRGFNNKLKTALDIIPVECERRTAKSSHLHDFLAHETSMLCTTALIFSYLQYVGALDISLTYAIATRPSCIIPESEHRMNTDAVKTKITLAIMDGEDNYGLLQACPSLVLEIAVPTMKSAWVKMINALVDRDLGQIEEIRKEAHSASVEDLLAAMAQEEVQYSTSVILAQESAPRHSIQPHELRRIALVPDSLDARATGDTYTTSVRTTASRFSRALAEHQPDHVVAAVCVRSVVWSRLRDYNPVQLAKLLFQDPDADYTLISHCAKSDFWRAIVIEIAKVRHDRSLSNMVMATFLSLGIPDLHIAHSNNIPEVTHSVASFFGANLRMVTVIVGEMISSLGGRKSRDYEKPFAEKVITNNPSLLDAKFRSDHINKIIKANKVTYKERLEKLINGNPTHRGDKRAEDRHARIVELRCRKYMYDCVVVNSSGIAIIDEGAFAETIYECATRVAVRVNFPESMIPRKPDALDSALDFMGEFEDKLSELDLLTHSGWNSTAGSIGARIAYETIMFDADQVALTKYAVSAAEIAPKLHKRVVTTDEGLPGGSEKEPITEAPVWSGKKLMGDEVSIANLDIRAFFKRAANPRFRAMHPAWKMLYALILTGHYKAKDVNEKLGTQMATRVTCSTLREGHLEDFEDDEINRHFPRVLDDFISYGLVFDESWLTRDEADAYTTDEMNLLPKGFLF